MIVKSSHLLAAMCFMPTDRPELQCVRVESDGKTTFVVGAGRFHGCFITEAREQAPDALSIPMGAISMMGLQPDSDVEILRVGGMFALGNTMFAPVTGMYPNWRKFLPTQFDAATINIKPEWLEAHLKAAECLGCCTGYLQITHGNATMPAGRVTPSCIVLIAGHPEYLGVVAGNHENCFDPLKHMEIYK